MPFGRVTVWSDRAHFGSESKTPVSKGLGGPCMSQAPFSSSSLLSAWSLPDTVILTSSLSSSSSKLLPPLSSSPPLVEPLESWSESSPVLVLRFLPARPQDSIREAVVLEADLDRLWELVGLLCWEFFDRCARLHELQSRSREPVPALLDSIAASRAIVTQRVNLSGAQTSG